MSAGRWLQVVLVVLGVLATVAFAVQNSARTTDLSFDVGLAAWQLDRPVQIPVLIGASFGTGLFVGLGLMAGRVVRQATKIRELEERTAMSSFGAAGSERPERRDMADEASPSASRW